MFWNVYDYLITAKCILQHIVAEGSQELEIGKQKPLVIYRHLWPSAVF